MTPTVVTVVCDFPNFLQANTKEGFQVRLQLLPTLLLVHYPPVLPHYIVVYRSGHSMLVVICDEA